MGSDEVKIGQMTNDLVKNVNKMDKQTKDVKNSHNYIFMLLIAILLGLGYRYYIVNI